MSLGLGHRLTADRKTVPETAGSLYCNLIGSLCQHPAIKKTLGSKCWGWEMGGGDIVLGISNTVLMYLR